MVHHCLHQLLYIDGESRSNQGSPCGSASEEYVCNVGDVGSIPGLGRSPEKEIATHSSTLAWRIP